MPHTVLVTDHIFDGLAPEAEVLAGLDAELVVAAATAEDTLGGRGGRDPRLLRAAHHRAGRSGRPPGRAGGARRRAPVRARAGRHRAGATARRASTALASARDHHAAHRLLLRASAAPAPAQRRG